ncbi:MAG: protein jag [Eubacteriales bacterium]|nr:protein jag [Eubacteriales bacterium]MDD3074376.1 protein jag [Eubacteriales bacterium]MDD4079523.1 protein jag [Eubacteriales bacterium]MDD4768394.1 protein jag [Eubacteriales bacterium]
MKEVTGTGKTVEEAIESALSELSIKREDADITIVELPTKGLFGILPGKNAVVQVREQFDPVLFAADWIEQILEKMRIHARVGVRLLDERIELDITGNNLGVLIGRRGQTLDALQYITTLAVNKKTAEFVPVQVDAGGYREKRRLTIQKNALSAKQKAVKTGRKIALEPMTPAERRLVHMALSDDHDVVTYSIGEEPSRRVVIDLKRD